MSASQTSLGESDEPWKDKDTLRELYEDKTQSEISQWFRERGFDVTASTISYWMKKLSVNTSHTDHGESDVPDGAECMTCSGETVGPNNHVCDECLDDARQADRENS